MTDRLGLKQLEPDCRGLEKLRHRIARRQQRVAGIQAAAGLAMTIALVVVLKSPDAEPLPGWAAGQPAVRIAERSPGGVIVVNGRQRTLARTSRMTLYLIDSQNQDRQPEPVPPQT